MTGPRAMRNRRPEADVPQSKKPRWLLTMRTHSRTHKLFRRQICLSRVAYFTPLWPVW